MKFLISHEITQKFPDAIECIVVLRNINNRVGGDKIYNLLLQQQENKKTELKDVDISKHKYIKPWRTAYKSFGSDPDKYHSSLEALLLRVLQGQKLPNINPLVNLYNYFSIKYLLPFGGEDFGGVYGNMTLKYAKGSEEYTPIMSNKIEHPNKGEICWIDEKGVTCRRWNWRQCERTKITESTKSGYFIIDGLPPVTKKQIRIAALDFIEMANQYFGAEGKIFWLHSEKSEAQIGIKTKAIIVKDETDTVRDLFKNVVLAEITNIQKHPDTDNLKIINLNTGNGQVQNITSSEGYKEGDLVPFLHNNNFIPGYLIFKNQKKLIEKKDFLGKESNGLILAYNELGIEDKEKLYKFPYNKALFGKNAFDFFSKEEKDSIVSNLNTKKRKPDTKWHQPALPFQQFEDKNQIKYQIKKLLYNSVSKIFKDSIPGEEEISVEIPQKESFGDYSSNIAMILAGKIKRNPHEIASEITKNIEPNKYIEKVETIGGFINFKLDKNYLLDNLNQILKSSDRYGMKFDTTDYKIIVEFGQPNTHKMPHIGHLFSYVLGESLSRLIKAIGLNVYKANYQGDIGPHVAKCIWAFLRFKPAIPKTAGGKAQMLQLMYQKGSEAYYKNDKSKLEIDQINKKIYTEDASIVKVWEETRNWSVEFYKQFEKKLYVTYDKSYFESMVAEEGKKIVESNIGKVFKKSEGAIIFEGSKFGLHDRVFITKKGTPTYEAKDMALQPIKYKYFPYNFMIISTAHEQNEYFNVVFKALEELDTKYKGKLYHLGFGMLNLKTGKMSSRTGNIITGVDLIDQSISAIRELIKDRKNLTEIEKEEVANVVGIGAVKYSLLKTNPLQDTIFNFQESINFEGNSGPYLQYTYARAKSILKNQNLRFENSLYEPNDLEISILRTFSHFDEIVFAAASTLSPNILANYLFSLAQKFNLFYKKYKVLKAEDKDITNFRLALTMASSQILKNGLNLLGIKILEKM